MKRRIIVFVQIAMLLMVCFPAIAMADETSTITMSLGKTKASVGDSITASGTSASGAWVPLKVVDGAGNIVVFDATKANRDGSYTIDFKVPAGASGTLTVIAGEGSNVVTKDLLIQTGTGTGGGGGGGSPPTPVVPEPVLPEPEPEVAVPVPGDVAGHWAEEAIKTLIAKNAMNGYPDGTFKPENLISRAEFATIVVKAFQLEAKGSKVFNDTASHWGREYIQTAYAHGIILGYNDSRFGPDDLITREQMAVMIIRVVELEKPLGELTFTDSWKISDWAKEAVRISAKHQIINGYPDNTFRPADNAKRSEAATVIVNALNK